MRSDKFYKTDMGAGGEPDSTMLSPEKITKTS
jgi:hypothetical protein